MPLIILGVIFIVAGTASIAGQDKHKSYDSDTTRQMLKDMTGKSKYTLGIIFYRDGKESKVYNYSGTYAEILNRLGIPVITKSDYMTTMSQLEYYKENHGTICPFFGITTDYSEQIKEYEEKIKYFNSDKVIREWEL